MKEEPRTQCSSSKAHQGDALCILHYRNDGVQTGSIPTAKIAEAGIENISNMRAQAGTCRQPMEKAGRFELDEKEGIGKHQETPLAIDLRSFISTQIHQDEEATLCQNVL